MRLQRQIGCTIQKRTKFKPSLATIWDLPLTPWFPNEQDPVVKVDLIRELNKKSYAMLE
jgi:hypothetical protein